MFWHFYILTVGTRLVKPHFGKNKRQNLHDFLPFPGTRSSNSQIWLLFIDGDLFVFLAVPQSVCRDLPPGSGVHAFAAELVDVLGMLQIR